ncbi:MAG: hypothetical protein QW757_01440, partial [Candidatus Woesearchaeota archaeon]
MTSPLQEFIKAIREAERREQRDRKIKRLMKHESYVLLFIITIFSIGLFYNLFGQNLTGFLIFENTEIKEVINVNKEFYDNNVLRFNVNGNLTSLKITGSIIGNGSVKVLLIDKSNNSKLVLDSNELNRKNILTGLVVEDIVQEYNQENNLTNNEVNPSVNNQELIEITEETQTIEENNIINENFSVGESSNLENISLNNSHEVINEEIIEISLNQSLNETTILNETIIEENIIDNNTNIANEINETNFTDVIIPEIIINETITESNASENITIEERVLLFSNYCLETCKLYNYGDEIVLQIIVENAVLNLSSIEYTFIENVFVNESLNETFLNETLNETLVNETLQIINLTMNLSSDEIGVIDFNYSAKINEPVLWKKKINLSITNYTILPKSAFNISVNNDDIKPYVYADKNLIDVEQFNKVKKIKSELKELEKPVSKDKANLVLNKLNELNSELQNLNNINFNLDNVNDVVLVFEKNDSENLSENNHESEILELSFYTEPPKADEIILNENKKHVVISSDLHYENVLAYTNIKESKKENIKVYWIKDDQKILFENVNYFDTNDNGFIDKIEWIVPHLSNQTFEISIIVLNPYTYLKDNEIWIVAFNTSGIANLSISSTNANWTEISVDNNQTFDEMLFLNLSCGNYSLLDKLLIVDVNNITYNYSDLSENSVKIKKLFIPNFECNQTAYLKNYMIKAGYATLLFEFENDLAYVSDYAYDPSAPTHDNPYITPDPAYPFNNLTCNANNVFDADGDQVVNITTWYKNNRSIYLLYLTFANDNESVLKDYSFHNYDIVNNSAKYNKTIGRIGGSFYFDGNSYIDLGQNIALGENFTIELWYKGSESEYYKGLTGAVSTNGYALQIDQGLVRAWINGNQHYGTSYVNDNIWHHIVLQRENGLA